MHRAARLIATCCFLVLLSTTQVVAQTRTETVLRSGDSAAGNGVFDRFVRVVFSNNGLIVEGLLEQTQNGEDDDFGLFSVDSNGVFELARQGDVPPEGNGVFNGPRFNSQDSTGNVYFHSGFFGVQGRSFYRHDGNRITRLFGTGDVTSDGSISSLGNPKSNRRGQVATIAGLQNTSLGHANDQALINWNGSTLQEIVREGGAALDDNGNFGRLLRTDLNFFNQVLLFSNFENSVGNGVVDQGLTLWTNGVGQQVVRSGQSLDGVVVESFGDESINSAGQVAFGADYLDSTTSGNSFDAIFLHSDGSTMTIAKNGDSAVDGNGQLDFISDLHLNNSGQAAYLARLAGTSRGRADNNAIMRSDGELQSQIFRTGSQGPGSVGELTRLQLLAMNESGQVLAVNDSSNIITSDGVDSFEVVSRGDTFDGKNIVSLGSLFGTTALNDFGQIVYSADLDDGSRLVNTWTPEIHYRNSVDGNWDDSGNWTLSLNPARVHDVFISPDSNVTVLGPAGTRNISSLQLGSGLGQARLELQSSSNLSVLNGVTIANNGLLTGNGGTLNGNVENSGVLGGNLVVNGNVAESGTGHLSVANESLVINGNLNALNPIQMIGGRVTINGDVVFNNPLASTTTGTLELNGQINATSSTITQETTFATSLVLGSNANSVFQFDQNGMDSWLVSGNLHRNGTLTIESSGAFAGLGFNESFLITNSLATSSGQFDGLNEGALVGNFDGVDIFISYLGGNGDDTILTTAIVPQWSGGSGNWMDESRWINGLPTINSRAVLIDNDDSVNSTVSTFGQTPTVQRLIIDSGDTLVVERSSNSGASGNLEFDLPSSSELTSAQLENNGLVQVDTFDSIGFRSDLEISGAGTINLESTSSNIRQGDRNLKLVNGVGHTIQGQGRIESHNIDNFGLIDANVDRAGSLTNLTISGQQGGGIAQGLLNNHGTLRASNGGGLLISIRETDGGIIEAVGSGSRVQVNPNRFGSVPATVFRNTTFRTSGGGTIDLRGNDRDAVFLEDVTNEGFIQTSHVRMFGNTHNTGTMLFLNGFDDNISLGSDISITGDGSGVLDFRQGGRNFVRSFNVEVQDNLIRGLGTFDSASTRLKTTVLDPENRGRSSQPEIGVFEFLSSTTIDSSELRFDFIGNRVAKDTNTPLGAPDENIVNTFRDTFSSSGLKSVNLEFDQLNFFRSPDNGRRH